MGSSSWLTIASGTPLLDDTVKPYVFAHVVPGMFISATSIFSSGTSLSWVRDTLAADFAVEAERRGQDVHTALIDFASTSPRGAHGLLFVPTLGGGTSFEGGPALFQLLVARACVLEGGEEQLQDVAAIGLDLDALAL